jgi:hypothetical protein
MTVRIVTPAGAAASVSFDWDGGAQVLQAGQFIDVPPGSDLEAAIGPANLAVPTSQQLASAANGAGPAWTSNA